MKVSNTMLAALVPAMVSLAPVAAHATAPTVTVFNSTALGFGGNVVDQGLMRGISALWIMQAPMIYR